MRKIRLYVQNCEDAGQRPCFPVGVVVVFGAGDRVIEVPLEKATETADDGMMRGTITGDTLRMRRGWVCMKKSVLV